MPRRVGLSNCLRRRGSHRRRRLRWRRRCLIHILKAKTEMMGKSKKRRSETLPAIDPNSRATVSGPAAPKALVDSSDELTAKLTATQQLSAGLPFNANKALE